MSGERVRPEGAGPRLSDGGPPAVETTDDESATDEEEVSADAAVERIRERATEVRDSELETAIAKLESHGDLSEHDREAVEALADSLVDQLLAVPESTLREAADAEDDRTVETALELFG